MSAVDFGLARWRDLLIAFAIRDLKVRYFSARLGAITTFGVSLLMMVVLSAVLGRVFRGAVQGPYPLYVFAGLIPWNFLSSSLNHAPDSFRQSAAIVRKVPFPRALVPLGVVAANSLNLLISFAAFIPIAVALGARPSWTWLALPLAIAVLIVFAAGLAMIVATAGVFFVEVRPLLDVFVMLWFYSTPIFYPASIIPERFQWVLGINPMANLAGVFRSLLVLGEWPTAAAAAYPSAFALVTLLAGWRLLRRYQGIIPDQVG